LNAGAFVASPIFNGNAAGIYTITVRDANLCTKTVLRTVAAAPTLLVFGTPTLTQASCVGGTGSASLSASGGTGTKTYTITPLGPQSNTTGSFTGLTAQTYTVTVTDANACTKTTAITISNPASMVFSTPIVGSPLCFGMITGTISTTATGGTGAKTYTISPSGPQSNTTGSFSNLAAQSYTVTATDANLCTKTTVVVVTAPQNITFNSPTINQPACNGSLGSVAISANGGTNPKTYTINPLGPQSNPTGNFTNLSAQNYTITVTDNNLCVLTTSLSLTNPTPVNITSANINQAVCFGSTSSANITAGGGTAPYTYSITPLNSTNSSGLFSSLVAGVYTVTASDANACSSNTVIIITQPASFTVTPSVTNMPCVNGTTTISASSSGGVGLINYAWYGQDITSVNLSANKDNTIFEQNQGNSNGAGPYLGVGRNNQSPGYKTRALISFNLTSLPYNAEIQNAILNLNSSQPSNVAGPQSHSLHKLLQNWGEGSSYSTQGGVGAPASSTDATWLSTFHTISSWTTAGGSFNPTSSASTIVDNAGAYSWNSPSMVTDIQYWLNNPTSNFGWMLKSDETNFPDAKRYDSREGNVPPSLDITYSTPILIGSGNALNNAVTGTYTVVAMDINGCTTSSTIVITEVPCNSELQLTTFLQGYYIGASTMTTTMLNQNFVNAASDDVDDITVELHEVANPSNIVSTTLARLKTNGIANCIFPPLNGNYYVVVNHRNSIQTWSADPVTISSSPATYNFSIAANKAYGSNMIEMETGVWALYTGDLNQDGYIDGFDYPDFDNDSQNNISGVYVATDLNGDGYVDGFDYPVFDLNSQNNVSAVTP
ncbi:MAG: DNRLRE domain-containing protein, partial [Chitinophagaceae bacterium]|nr:DNRLRE domain-containing protein [Chitinophagaceae bacterium]